MSRGAKKYNLPEGGKKIIGKNHVTASPHPRKQALVTIVITTAELINYR